MSDTGLSEGPAPQYYDEIEAIWPDLYNGQATVSPARNGMNRYTGALLQGWPHVQQSLDVIFMTPFHVRVLRRWVGSFVPLLLGRNLVARLITRFWWAMMTAVDLWEPDYKITRVNFMNTAGQSPAPTTASNEQMIRAGQVIMGYQGVYYPRGHLGDFTPATSAPQNVAPLSLPPASTTTVTTDSAKAPTPTRSRGRHFQRRRYGRR